MGFISKILKMDPFEKNDFPLDKVSAVLSSGIPGKVLRAFPGSFRLPESPSRGGGMAHLFWWVEWKFVLSTIFVKKLSWQGKARCGLPKTRFCHPDTAISKVITDRDFFLGELISNDKCRIELPEE